MTSLIAASASRAVSFSRKSAVVALGATMLALVSLNASAGADSSRQTVEFRDLDLTKSADTERLYRRLRTASQQVCGIWDRGAASRHNPRTECAATALNNAVTTIGHPSLTALHAARTDVRLAQSTKSGSTRS